MHGDVAFELGLGRVGQVVAQRFGEELVGRGEVFLAVPEEDAGAAVVGAASGLGHECGLPQPGFAGHQHHLAQVLTGDTPDGVGQHLKLARPPDDADVGSIGESAGKGWGAERRGAVESLPSHGDGLDGFGKPLQVEATHAGAGVRIASTGHEPYDVGGEDLAGSGGGRQSGRFHDRVTEVVAVLLGHLAAAEADPKADGMLAGPVVEFDSLLHGHCARDGRGRRPEHDHQAVAEVLDLGAAGLGDGLAEDGEVGATHLVGLLGRVRHRQLGRSDHVGEQDDDGLGAHFDLSLVSLHRRWEVRVQSPQGDAGR